MRRGTNNVRKTGYILVIFAGRKALSGCKDEICTEKTLMRNKPILRDRLTNGHPQLTSNLLGMHDCACVCMYYNIIP